MSKTLCITAGLLLSALVAGEAAAQWNVARFDTQPNRVYTSFGLDPAFVTTVGYGRVVPVFGHGFQLSGDAGVAAAGLDTRDFRARIQAMSPMVRWRSAYLTGSATFITRGTQNEVYRGLNFGADIAGTAGVYRPRWFAASEFGFDKAVITHITHTDWYRRYIYADAKDGWYLDAGGNFHYGLTGGVAFGRMELSGRVGWQKTAKYEALTPPMYGSVGVGFGF